MNNIFLYYSNNLLHNKEHIGENIPVPFFGRPVKDVQFLKIIVYSYNVYL